MKSKIYLKDLDYNTILEYANRRNDKHLFSDHEHYYSPENIKRAIKANIEKDLNYNCKTGIIRYGSEWMGCYSNKKDIPVYENELEVLEWEFLNFIANSAGRLQRGYAAIG
ncbi:MAG TPA: hypothetical protein GX708_01845 [Gallicola sp.]|nr:hypothetical protein [Gallicola sp.]